MHDARSSDGNRLRTDDTGQLFNLIRHLTLIYSHELLSIAYHYPLAHIYMNIFDVFVNKF